MIAFVLYACSSYVPRVFSPGDSAPNRPVDVSSVPDAVPTFEAPSRGGNPRSYVVRGKRYYKLPSAKGYRERGIASWYGTKFHGRKTSNGETYDMYAMTAAHKTLPLPSFLRVTNLKNHRQVVVRVNDHGPFHANRIIDLSYAAASKLGILKTGTGLVELEAVFPGSPSSATRYASAPVSSFENDESEVIQNDHTGLFLQVGAFSNKDNASRMKTRLHSLFKQPINIQSVKVASGRVYRVRVGPLGNVDAVDHMVERLADVGLDSVKVVIE